MRLTVRELAAIVGGEVVAPTGGDPVVTSFSFDSRVLEPGACFVALRGARDGHGFVIDAFAAGATTAIVERPVEGAAAALGPQVVVGDPLRALGDLGAEARRRLGATVVGITGSVGKTATKDLAAAAVGTVRVVHASPASYNNEAGVPITLLSAPPGTEVVICEMGARAIGDLTYLCGIARPAIAAITAIAPAHSGPLGGLEGVVRAKGEIVEGLPPEGTAVINADAPHADALVARSSAPVLTVGSEGAEIVYRGVQVDEALVPRFELVTPWGSREVTLALRGAHQAANAAMAAAIALALGVPLDDAVAGLASARGAAHRMVVRPSPQGITVLDDSYNANPVSMAAALRSLAALAARRRVAVLGEMLELGDESEAAHRELGRLATELGIDVVVAVGRGAASVATGVGSGTRVLAVADREAAADAARAEVGRGDAVLVKASRAVGLDAIADALVGVEGAA